jgi:hypothetical protein
MVQILMCSLDIYAMILNIKFYLVALQLYGDGTV